ncbi:MAG: hypothetical protein IPI85_13015 [Dehalococcoidia bacterium]|nr:hypothetical protein [Dehalococcoidia bacterium]
MLTAARSAFVDEACDSGGGTLLRGVGLFGWQFAIGDGLVDGCVGVGDEGVDDGLGLGAGDVGDGLAALELVAQGGDVSAKDFGDGFERVLGGRADLATAILATVSMLARDSVEETVDQFGSFRFDGVGLFLGKVAVRYGLIEPGGDGRERVGLRLGGGDIAVLVDDLAEGEAGAGAFLEFLAGNPGVLQDTGNAELDGVGAAFRLARGRAGARLVGECDAAGADDADRDDAGQPNGCDAAALEARSPRVSETSMIRRGECPGQ